MGIYEKQYCLYDVNKCILRGDIPPSVAAGWISVAENNFKFLE